MRFEYQWIVLFFGFIDSFSTFKVFKTVNYSWKKIIYWETSELETSKQIFCSCSKCMLHKAIRYLKLTNFNSARINYCLVKLTDGLIKLACSQDDQY